MLCNKQPQNSVAHHNKHSLLLLTSLLVSWALSPSGCGLGRFGSRVQARLKPAPCVHSGVQAAGTAAPLEKSFSWHITEGIKDKTSCTSTSQASTCVTPADSSLAKASHVAKPKVIGAGKYTLPQGRRYGSDHLLKNDLINHKSQETLLSKPPCHIAGKVRPREKLLQGELEPKAPDAQSNALSTMPLIPRVNAMQCNWGSQSPTSV